MTTREYIRVGGVYARGWRAERIIRYRFGPVVDGVHDEIVGAGRVTDSPRIAAEEAQRWSTSTGIALLTSQSDDAV
jgi:hypothetical protein